MVVEKVVKVGFSHDDMAGIEFRQTEKQELNEIAQKINQAKNDIEQLKQNFFVRDVKFQLMTMDAVEIAKEQANQRQALKRIDEIILDTAQGIQECKKGFKEIGESFNQIEGELNECKRAFTEIKTHLHEEDENLKNLNQDYREIREKSEKLRDEFIELKGEFHVTNADMDLIVEDQKQILKDLAKIRKDQDQIGQDQNRIKQDQNRIEQDQEKIDRNLDELQEFYGQDNFWGDVKKKLDETFVNLNRDCIKNPPVAFHQYDCRKRNALAIEPLIPVNNQPNKETPENHKNFQKPKTVKLIMAPEIIAEIPKDVYKDSEPPVKAEVHNIPVQIINVKKVNPQPDAQIIKKIPSKNAFLATIKKTIEAFIQRSRIFSSLKKCPTIIFTHILFLS